MAVKTVEAQLVLGGKDGGAAASVNALVKAFEQAEKAGAGVSKSTAQVAKTLLEVEKAQAAVNTVMGARNGAATAEINLRKVTTAAGETKTALDKARTAVAAFEGQKAAKGSDLAKQMTEAAKAAALAEKAHKAATREVVQATRAHEMQARALRDAERAAAAANVPLAALEQHQRTLAMTYDRATEAMRRQIRVEGEAARAAQHHAKEQAEAAKHMRQHGVMGVAGALASGAVGVHGVTHVIQHSLKSGAEVQSNRVDMAKAGIGFAERQHITDESLRLATTYKNVTQASVMELWKEMRSVMTDPHEVDHIIDPMVRAKSLLDAKDKTGMASHGLNLLVKGAESIGAAKDPERFVKLLDGYIKAMQVMGSTVTPEGIYEMQKYSKASGGRWSDRFIMTTAQSLGQELGGSTAGNSIDIVTRQIVGGMQNLHSKAREFANIGLIDEKNLDVLKTGEVKGVKKGVKHAVKGDTLAASDLDKWVYTILVPALQAHGIKTEDEQVAWAQKNFTGTGGSIVAKLIQQRESFEAHAKMYEGATGLKGAGLNSSDPIAAMGEVTKSMETFLGVVSSPIMVQAAHGLDAIATAISGWSMKLDAFNKAHPDLAKWEAPVAAGAGLAGAGVASAVVYKALTSGFGLTGSAAALDHSALMLEAAAIRLSGGQVPNSVKALASAGAPALAGLGLGGVVAGLGVGAGLGIGATVMEMPKVAAEKGATGIDPATGGTLEANPMDGIGPDHPWMRDWWTKHAPVMLGGVAEKAGNEAGQKAGDGMKDGIKTKTPEVVDEAQSLFERLQKVFSSGIAIPMSFNGGGDGGGIGGGGLIQKASFDAGGGLGGYSGGSGYAGTPVGKSRGIGGLGGGGGSSGGSAMQELPGSLQATESERNALGLILKYESRGRNVMNYEGVKRGLDPSTARGYTAQGYFQMLNSNWRRIAPRLGITARNAMSGSFEEQSQVALYLLRNGGIGNWSRYNPSLRAALARGEKARFRTKDAAALDPHLVRGADGIEGLDLGNGSMRMPDGSVRTIPSAPPAGASMGEHVSELGRHIDRLADAQIRSHHTVEVNASPGLSAKTKKMRIQSDGPVRGSVGTSMPQTEIG